MLEAALRYAQAGWPVFRLGPSKTPLKGTHGHLDATTDATILRAWWGNASPNIGLATGNVIVIDADGPEAIARLQEMGAPHGGLPKTLTAQTRRGLHLYYLAPPGVEIRTRNEPRAKKGDSGIDIKGRGGYVVMPPSVSKGFVYKWLLAIPPVTMPEWLVNWCQSAGNGRVAPSALGNLGPLPNYLSQQNQQLVSKRASEALRNQWTALEENRIRSALAAIPAVGYDRWREIGMALQSLGWERSDGTDRGFELFDEWSATAPDSYSPEGTEAKWRSFGKRGGITIGSLFHIAGEHGWQPPAPREAPPPFTLAGQAPEIQPTGKVNGHHLPEALTRPSNSDSPLIQMNDQYSVIGDVGGKCLVMGWVQSKVDPTVKLPSFQSFRAFTERFANRYCQVTKVKGEQFVEEPAQVGATWLKWRQRKTYEGIDLEPGGEAILPGNILNLWSGFAVEPQQGSWDLMKAHIMNVLARGDVVALEYIMKWAAWKIQNPGKRTEVALVFKGSKGSGKGTFANALRRMFGQHGLQIFNSKHLVGSFNGHLRNCLLLFADEAFWAGDKQGESVLKGMLTEPSLMIEQKGVDAISWKNQLGVIMAANADWVVPASHDERRYAMFEVSDAHKQDESYFNPLWRELDNGGLSAMLYDLQHAKLGNWHPRKIPQTEALQMQKLRSLDPRYEWFEQLLSDGVLPGLKKDMERTVPTIYLWNHAKDNTPRLRDLSIAGLGRFLSDQGCLKIHNATGNSWRFNSLAEHRDKWKGRFGNWNWSYEGADWALRN